MAKPTYYPEWATTTKNLPNTGQTNKVRPKTSLRTIGWDYGQMLTAEEWNWQFGNIYEWITYIDKEASQNYLPKNGTKITFSGDLSGTASFVGDAVINASIQVVDNSHKHTSDNISDATALPTPDTIMRRDANAGVMAGDITSCATSTTDSATYFFQDTAGKTIGNISSQQGDTGSLTIARVTPSNQTAANRINITTGNGVQINNPRSLNVQETNAASLVRYDYLTSQLNAVQSDIDTVSKTTITGIRQSAETLISNTSFSNYNSGRRVAVPNGAYITSLADFDTGRVFLEDVDGVWYKYIQYRMNGTWYNIGSL